MGVHPRSTTDTHNTTTNPHQFVRQLLAPERNNTLVAAARRVSPELQRLADANPGRLVLTDLDVADEASIKAWAGGVKKQVNQACLLLPLQPPARKTSHTTPNIQKPSQILQVGKVDVLINNAGVYGPSSQSIDRVDAKLLSDVFAVNAAGPLLVTQQLRAAGALARPALVANITSKMGSVDDNTSGACYAYRASKAALNIMTKSLSLDLAPEGVQVALLHPGYVMTPMTGGAGLISTEQVRA